MTEVITRRHFNFDKRLERGSSEMVAKDERDYRQRFARAQNFASKTKEQFQNHPQRTKKTMFYDFLTLSKSTMKNVDSSEILIFQRGVSIHTSRKNMARPRANMLFNGD